MFSTTPPLEFDFCRLPVSQGEGLGFSQLDGSPEVCHSLAAATGRLPLRDVPWGDDVVGSKVSVGKVGR